MRVPFLELRNQYLEIKDELDAAALRVLDSGWYVLGDECRHFEEAFKQYLVGEDEGYVVGVNSGTDALKLSLLAAGVRQGDEVITVANTAIPTVTAICSIGAVPVFCDVDSATWLLNPGLVESSITSRTRAIVPVHLYGAPCDMAPILALAEKHGLVVVEDVAQATGAEYSGKGCGTLGDFGAFSFYPSKNLGACGDGGAIFTRSPEKREILLKLRNYGQSSRYYAELQGGENSRLDEIQAAILGVKLRHLARWNKRRQDVAQLYLEGLRVRGLELQTQQFYPQVDPARHLFVIKVPRASRSSLVQQLSEKGVQTLVHYPVPLHRQEAFAHFSRGEKPSTEELCDSVLSLPFHSYLDPEDIDYVLDALLEFL